MKLKTQHDLTMEVVQMMKNFTKIGDNRNNNKVSTKRKLSNIEE